MIYWEIANELRGDFRPATVIGYLSAWVEQEKFRHMYQRFMTFATAATNAKSN